MISTGHLGRSLKGERDPQEGKGWLGLFCTPTFLPSSALSAVCLPHSPAHLQQDHLLAWQFATTPWWNQPSPQRP
jgi:hypothetical protein